jgi:hypothetical protein
MKNALVILSFSLLSLSAYAQNSNPQVPPPPPAPTQSAASATGNTGKPKLNPADRAAKTADRLGKKLGLTQQQHDDVYQVLMAQYKQVEVIKEQNSAKAQIKAIRDDSEAKLKQILGADKYAQWQAMREQHKGNKGGGQGQPADPGVK